MTEPTLVIMAAGMGSRFGGLKQVAPVDRAGHPILAFSLYDAWRAGFRQVAFVIKRELETEFGSGSAAMQRSAFRSSMSFRTSTACRRASKCRWGV